MATSPARVSLASLVVAIVLAGPACNRKDPDRTPATSSAAGSGEHVGADGVDVAAGSAGDCPADIGPRVETAMAATDVYFTKVSDVTKTWTDATGCDVVLEGLGPLIPAAEVYVEVVEASKLWARDLTEACRDRLDKLYVPKGKGLEAKHRAVIEGGLAQIKRCADHPGVVDTAQRAIRLMKKR